MPSAARAQTNGPGDVWISAGAGGGWSRVACAICRVQRNLGPTGYLRFGANVRPGLLLGAEGNVWTRVPGDDEREWVGAFSAVGYLYPRANGALYVKGGLGYLTYRSSAEDDDLTLGSVGVVLGAGYEFRVGSSLLLTNYVNLHASSFGSLKSGDTEVISDVSVTLFQLGVGLTRR
ncbi:MAG: hypothetical protein ACREMA_00535 [Longimicrobiales bacterium]